MSDIERSLAHRAINRRITVLFSVMVTGILALTARMIQLQLVQHDELKKRAESQQTKQVQLAGRRGLIVDRRGAPMALNMETHSLYAQPQDFDRPIPEIARLLAPIIQEKEDVLASRLLGKSFRWIKRKLPEEQAKAIRALEIKGLDMVREYQRVYPNGPSAAALIGFTGIDNQGLAGLELTFDQVLLNGGERLTVVTDALGQEMLRQGDGLPVLAGDREGNRLELALDQRIQHVAERELNQGLKAYQAQRGLAMVMDLETGDLLALATAPGFNPNQFQQADWGNIKNWAVTDQYEPGSTMKVLTLAAALEAGVVDPSETMATPAEIRLEGWRIEDHGVPKGSIRRLKPVDIIEISSNVAISLISHRMTAEQHRAILAKFGLGQSTDTFMLGEVSGLLPELPWSRARQATISFGQGVAVTPLQMLMAMSAFPRQGKMIVPRPVRRVLDQDGHVVSEVPVRERAVVSAQTAQQLMDMMVHVVHGAKGTGVAGRIPGYLIAGKTGTADKVVNGRYSGDVMSSFIGIVPAQQPRLVVMVLYDSPRTRRYAAETAVPVFRRITQDAVRILGIPPSRSEELLTSQSPNL